MYLMIRRRTSIWASIRCFYTDKKYDKIIRKYNNYPSLVVNKKNQSQRSEKKKQQNKI